MKKLFIALLIVVFCAIPVLAKDAFNGTVIESTKITDDAVPATSSAIDISQYDKIAFFVTADETDSGGNVTVVITIQISYDNSVWFAAHFYDYTNPATLQTSETLCAGVNTDADYYCWFNRHLNVPYIRVIATGAGTATGGDDEVTVIVNYSAQK